MVIVLLLQSHLFLLWEAVNFIVTYSLFLSAHITSVSYHYSCVFALCIKLQKKIATSIRHWVSVCDPSFLKICLNLTIKTATQRSAANCFIIIIATEMCDFLGFYQPAHFSILCINTYIKLMSPMLLACRYLLHHYKYLTCVTIRHPSIINNLACETLAENRKSNLQEVNTAIE